MAGLAGRLAGRGHQVVLVTLDNGQRNRHTVCETVRLVPLDVMRPSRSVVERLFNIRHRLAMIRDTIVNLEPDVVLSFCDRTNIDVLLSLKGQPLPIVISERSDPSQQDLGRWWEYQRSRTYRRADRVIALTRWAAEFLQPICGCEIDVIASAVDTPPIVSDRNTAQANQRIVAVGRLEHEKGFDRLLESFSTISQSHRQWSLRIIGEGSMRKPLQSQAKALGIDDRVSMPGWITPIWNELASASLFALPSRYEGFPSALLEAMAVGVPSIAVDCESGPREIIQHEVNGMLVPNHHGALSAGLTQMIQDAPFREQIGHAGRSVTTKFSWDTMVIAYEKVLQQAAQTNQVG